MSKLPSINELSDKAEFFIVDGVAVAVDDLDAFEYKNGIPAVTGLTDVMENGAEITREEFIALAKQ